MTSSPSFRAADGRAMRDIIAAQISRRSLLAGVAGGAALVSLKGLTLPAMGAGSPAAGLSSLDFANLAQVPTEGHAIAPGYSVQVLARWGDPIMPGAPAFDPAAVAPDAQARQFGFNCDFVAFMPLPQGSASSDHGLLFVNHEYGLVEAMFPRALTRPKGALHAQYEMAAHGASVIEVKRENGQWRVVADSGYARRITLATEMAVSGPAAGHPRLRTAADPEGRLILGTVNNCAGGKTPWGTILTCEENFHAYFGGDLTPDRAGEGPYDDRLGFRSRPFYNWFESETRFDRSKEPNEKNRFGWVVEVDPYDPQMRPVKRTALGRFKHEGATCALSTDGRVVVYTGDDQIDEYIYKFVSAKAYDPSQPGIAQGLLDEGTLYVARFEPDRLVWLPLVFGQGPLTPENGFNDQGDVLIEARRAAELLGATPMDRPEDIEPSPVTGKVYAVMTGNVNRTEAQVHPANPRSWNRYGHILEFVPPGTDGARDHAATEFAWDVLLLAGTVADPVRFPETPHWSAKYGPGTEVVLANPDNIGFDPKGRLWIGTDMFLDEDLSGRPDGLFACDVEGPGRAVVKFLFACPIGAELCSPEFTPDGTTVFAAVQHPGEVGPGAAPVDPEKAYWPDFQAGMPPRPSVVAITRDAGGQVGG